MLITLALLAIIAGLGLLWIAGTGANEGRRTQDTAKAMGLIRDALIARAASDLNRPGSLPCPDFSATSPNIADDGVSDLLSGAFCPNRVGRVPWRSLDIPDLRDADGNRFWYALSPVYNDSAGAGTLNSDTAGQLTVTGTQPLNDVVAIIFAPGAPLPTQDRVASPNVVASYLEGENANGDLTFTTGAASTTFNDQLLAITRDMLMPSVEQRVARQARRCLENFASQGGPGVPGRYPFPAAMSDFTAYADGVPNGAPPPAYITTTYGRIPSTLAATNDALLGAYGWPDDDPQPVPGASPPKRCFDSTTWWASWRELLLYRVAAAYAPSAATAGPCGSCLTVNSANDVEFVVIVAGRAFHDPLHATETPDQSWRSTIKSNAVYYLEVAPNPTISHITNFSGAGLFGKRPRVTTTGPLGGFNDRVECVSASEAPPCN